MCNIYIVKLILNAVQKLSLINDHYYLLLDIVLGFLKIFKDYDS